MYKIPISAMVIIITTTLNIIFTSRQNGLKVPSCPQWVPILFL
ncbi:hypothetical protein BTN50_1876 [Candidatus Enterovibrio altilux]|uniref:Uncharacterized protein n=1 Tax=Candidatus Enterovibrio altilux TaxID=1927128 RepID=A0A291BBC2_9GAMM|nr:hypothetical protein BTN50_1876 [Candidatus Enterovibrio luxaltus]